MGMCVCGHFPFLRRMGIRGIDYLPSLEVGKQFGELQLFFCVSGCTRVCVWMYTCVFMYMCVQVDVHVCTRAEGEST